MQEWQRKRRAEYVEKLKDPRWQKKRLEVLSRDEWCCQYCFDSESTLHVHHRYYEHGKEPWDYPIEAFLTLCEECHQEETESRPKAEQALLDTIRRLGYSAWELGHLTDAITGFRNQFRHPMAASSAMKKACEDGGVVQEICDWYFSEIRRENKAREEALKATEGAQV